MNPCRHKWIYLTLFWAVQVTGLVSFVKNPRTPTKMQATKLAEAAAIINLKSPGPLIITIGPPCSGKTSFLRKEDAVDVAIDDQPGIYIPLPREAFLNPSIRNDTLVFNKTISERVWSNDQEELRLLLERLCGKVDKAAFEEKIRVLFQEQSELISILCTTVEGCFGAEKTPELPEKVDLFIAEAIFKPSPLTNRSGLQECDLKMQQVPRKQGVASGNTNTKATDYRSILALASRQKRPVRFAVFTDKTVKNVTPAFEDLSDLYRRDLKRMLQTGRYIPLTVVKTMLERTDDLVRKALETQEQLGLGSLDESLARLAGYRMNKDGLVFPLQSKQPRQVRQRRKLG